MQPSSRKLGALLGAVISGGSLVVLWGAASIPSAPEPHWWEVALAALACGAGNLTLLHLRFGHDRHSFTWSEVAVIVGLVLVPAPWLAVVGAAAAAAAHLTARRPAAKVAFNALSFACGIALASLAAAALGVDPGTDELARPRTLLALAAASLAYFAWNLLTVSAAVAWSQGARVAEVARRGFTLVLLVWASNTAAGLLLTVAGATEPAALAVVPVAVVSQYVVYRAYLHAIEQRDIWQVLQATSRELQQFAEAEVARVVCARLPALLRAEFVELLLVDEAGARAYRSQEPAFVEGSVDDVAATFWPRVRSEQAPFVLDTPTAPARQAEELRAHGLSMCAVTPLLAPDGCIGSIRVGFRGPVRLRRDELQVLDTLANHVATAVRNAWLYEQTRAERMELDRILNESADGIAAVDSSWTVIRWNPAMAAITGLDVGQAVGRPLFAGIGVQDHRGRGLPAGLLAGALGDSARDPVTLELSTRAGRRWIRVSAGRGTDGDLWVVVAHDITERRQFEEQLAYQALHDPLTALPNRTLLLDRLGHALTLARRDGRPAAILFCDLDRFKVINDSLGHDVGDQLLVEAARRIASALREGDTSARLGGDEFAVLCERVESAADVAVVADRIMRGIAAPFLVAGRETYVTVSIGVSMSGDLPASPIELLRDADAAMYLAKDRGRNRVEFFTGDMRERALARLETESDLRRGIERGDLRLLFQPYMDLRHPEHVVGGEALLRWSHPRRGTVFPAEFIDLAEETGLVRPIGRWVLHETCRHLHAEVAGTGGPEYVSINVSAHELTDERFVQSVAAALVEWEVEPARLCLEITETALVSDAGAALGMLDQLKGLGVRLALDDFGTGYSALSYLRALPVDIVKIDRSFVSRLDASPRDRAVVAGIVELAHALGLMVVAEGVEREVEAGHLRALDCDLAQGFLFGRPGEWPAPASGRSPLDDPGPPPRAVG